MNPGGIIILSNSKNSDHMPWVEKYRPDTLDDVVAHRHIVESVVKLSKDKTMPHLLFYGPSGTGKTSTILALARYLYGKDMPGTVLELNASDDRGIDVIRHAVKNFASMHHINRTSEFKLVILDECDAMTREAQSALRRIVEKYTRNTRFCLICNHVSKIVPALQSRCTRFRFPPLNDVDIINRLHLVIAKEKVHIDTAGLRAIVKYGKGDMRSTLNVLQLANMTYERITEDTIHDLTQSPGVSSVELIISMCLELSLPTSLQSVVDIQRRGNLSLLEIITHALPIVLKLDLPRWVQLDLLEAFADIEYRLTRGSNGLLQLASFVS